MASMSVETVLALAVPVAGVIVWLIRLEGRINLQDARYSEIKESLSYIRARLDSALNGRDHS